MVSVSFSFPFMKKISMDELMRPLETDGREQGEGVELNRNKQRSSHVSFPELGKLALNIGVDNRTVIRTTSEDECVEPRKPHLFQSLKSFFTTITSSESFTAREPKSPDEPPSSKEYRRICSEVVPGQIFISGWLVAEDWNELSSRGITHVINTASSVSKCPFPDQICYLPLSIEDSKSEDIQSYFYICIDFIEAAINSGGRVLVHCMEGVSRSCSVVIAYLMWKRGLNYKDSQSFVQEARPICQPNTGFICQILEYQKVLARSLTKSRVWRIEAKQLADGQMIIIPCLQSHTLPCIDPRFVYLRRQEEAFDVQFPETPISGRIREIVDLLCDQISRIEKFTISTKCIAEDHFGIKKSIDKKLDSNHSSFLKCLSELPPGEIRIFGRPFCVVVASSRSSDPQITARSHRSHGSIDSTGGNSNVLVYQIDLETKILDQSIPYFDSDDLDSRAIYLFVVPSSDRQKPTAVVWVGNEVDEVDDDTVVGKIRELLEYVQDIHIVQQGSETDAFWNLFEQ